MQADTKFIVWDWNGTLLDDATTVLYGLNQSLLHIGRNAIDLATMRELLEFPFDKAYRNLGVSDQEFDTHKHALHSVFHDHYSGKIDSVGLRHGGHALLNRTHGQGLVHLILSNHLVEAIETHLDRVNSRSLIARVLAFATRQEQLEWATSKGNRLQIFMKEHGLRPENGVIVGDSAEETEIGRHIGLASVAITGGVTSESRLRDAKPDYLIHELPEMESVLAKQRLLP